MLQCAISAKRKVTILCETAKIPKIRSKLRNWSAESFMHIQRRRDMKAMPTRASDWSFDLIRESARNSFGFYSTLTTVPLSLFNCRFWFLQTFISSRVMMRFAVCWRCQLISWMLAAEGHWNYYFSIQLMLSYSERFFFHRMNFALDFWSLRSQKLAQLNKCHSFYQL